MEGWAAEPSFDPFQKRFVFENRQPEGMENRQPVRMAKRKSQYDSQPRASMAARERAIGQPEEDPKRAQFDILIGGVGGRAAENPPGPSSEEICV